MLELGPHLIVLNQFAKLSLLAAARAHSRGRFPQLLVSLTGRNWFSRMSEADLASLSVEVRVAADTDSFYAIGGAFAASCVALGPTYAAFVAR
mgnify:CR=1 FL=1